VTPDSRAELLFYLSEPFPKERKEAAAKAKKLKVKPKHRTGRKRSKRVVSSSDESGPEPPAEDSGQQPARRGRQRKRRVSGKTETAPSQSGSDTEGDEVAVALELVCEQIVEEQVAAGGKGAAQRQYRVKWFNRRQLATVVADEVEADPKWQDQIKVWRQAFPVSMPCPSGYTDKKVKVFRDPNYKLSQ